MERVDPEKVTRDVSFIKRGPCQMCVNGENESLLLGRQIYGLYELFLSV